MRVVKYIGILLLIYVGIVVVFESLLGYFQPANERTLVITTTDGAGAQHARVVSRVESNEQLYVAANHWPRAWYHQALENPQVQVDMDGAKGPYIAVKVDATEHERVYADKPLGLGFKILTGFPPRYFLRLEPSPES